LLFLHHLVHSVIVGDVVAAAFWAGLCVLLLAVLSIFVPAVAVPHWVARVLCIINLSNQ
jgi:hypothetical protein